MSLMQANCSPLWSKSMLWQLTLVSMRIMRKNVSAISTVWPCAIYYHVFLCPWALTFKSMMAQMGGPEGVRAAEMTSITLSCTKGMKMHAIARVPS